MEVLEGTFNQEKALVGAFSVIVKTSCGNDGSFYSTIQNIYCNEMFGRRSTCHGAAARTGDTRAQKAGSRLAARRHGASSSSNNSAEVGAEEEDDVVVAPYSQISGISTYEDYEDDFTSDESEFSAPTNKSKAKSSSQSKIPIKQLQPLSPLGDYQERELGGGLEPRECGGGHCQRYPHLRGTR